VYDTHDMTHHWPSHCIYSTAFRTWKTVQSTQCQCPGWYRQNGTALKLFS